MIKTKVAIQANVGTRNEYFQQVKDSREVVRQFTEYLKTNHVTKDGKPKVVYDTTLTAFSKLIFKVDDRSYRILLERWKDNLRLKISGVRVYPNGYVSPKLGYYTNVSFLVNDVFENDRINATAINRELAEWHSEAVEAVELTEDCEEQLIKKADELQNELIRIKVELRQTLDKLNPTSVPKSIYMEDLYRLTHGAW